MKWVIIASGRGSWLIGSGASISIRPLTVKPSLVNWWKASRATMPPKDQPRVWLWDVSKRNIRRVDETEISTYPLLSMMASLSWINERYIASPCLECSRSVPSGRKRVDRRRHRYSGQSLELQSTGPPSRSHHGIEIKGYAR